MLEEGKITELIFFLIAIGSSYYYLWQAMQGKLKDPIRVIPQVAALSDGVDKAVEEGGYIYCTAGIYAYLSGLYAPMTINGMNIMRYLAKLAVRRGAKIRFIASTQPEAAALIDGIYRQVCITEGKPEAYDRDAVRFYGGTEASYSTGAGADILDTGCSLCVSIGATSSAERFLLGSARASGALVVGGTPRYFHQATYTLMADYPLYCDDIYAAGAFAADNDVVSASLVGADLVKLVVIGSMILFAILGAAGLETWQTGIGWLFQ